MKNLNHSIIKTCLNVKNHIVNIHHNVFIAFQLLAILVASVSSQDQKNIEEPQKVSTETKDATIPLSRNYRHVDIDPHETLCWDVSIYTDVTFDQEPCEKCMPRLDTVRIPRQYKVCYE